MPNPLGTDGVVAGSASGKRPRAHGACWLPTAAVLCLACSVTLGEDAPRRSDWYRGATFMIHCDNHTALIGKGHSVEDLVKALGTAPCEMIQVSAQSNGYATYPTEVGPNNPDLEGYDTLATFKEVARRLNWKFCVYMSVDQRSLEIKDHPGWGHVGAAGKSPAGDELIVCQRPNREKKGYLYEKFIPQILEIIRKYDPDGFWFDGDGALTRPCWCERCLQAWKEKTRLDAPRDESSARWREWKDWHYTQYNEYRRLVAEAIHSASPRAMYTSNWSWVRTPEPVPDFVDTLSADEWNVRQTVCATMRWGAQQKTPWDMMSYAVADTRSLSRQYSLQRTLQEGALALSSGGAWFVWTFSSSLTPSAIEQTRFMSHFTQDRKLALGSSSSLSQVAVLDSETSWFRAGEYNQRLDSNLDGPACSVARSLSESQYFTDITNEETFRSQWTRYQIVVLPSQTDVAPETLAALKQFVESGGLLVLTGSSLHGGGDTEPPEISALAGLKRTGKAEASPAVLQLDQHHIVMGSWNLAPIDAHVVARFVDGRPALTLRGVGKGTVAYLAAQHLHYPDGGLVAAVLRKLNHGPSYWVSGEAPIHATLRRKPRQVVLHLTDLSARVDGVPSDVDTVAHTDWNLPLGDLQVTLPFPKAPARVSALPLLTRVKTEYHNGLLKLTLNRVQTHASVILDTDVDPPLALLPADSVPSATQFHPASERKGVVFAEDFEMAGTGSELARPWVSEVKNQTSILVTEETAAGGKKSLKFVDTADSPSSPFLQRSVGPFLGGRTRLSFDLRVDSGAICLVELRYSGKGTGPSVRFEGDGNILAGSRGVAKFTPGKWFHVEIEFQLGVTKTPYKVSIQTSLQPATIVADLPHASEWFFLCNRVDFTGSGNARGNFYLDNVTMERL